MAVELEKAFLAELESLEKFRISYTGLYPNAPLTREDPDVRRLMEAMAMFTARTRLAAERSLGAPSPRPACCGRGSRRGTSTSSSSRPA